MGVDFRKFPLVMTAEQLDAHRQYMDLPPALVAELKKLTKLTQELMSMCWTMRDKLNNEINQHPCTNKFCDLTAKLMPMRRKATNELIAAVDELLSRSSVSTEAVIFYDQQIAAWYQHLKEVYRTEGALFDEDSQL